MNETENHQIGPVTKPRRQYTIEERQAIMAEFEKTTLSPTEFAAKSGIHLTTLYQWRRPRPREATGGENANVQLQEMSLAGVLGRPGWAVELLSPKGWTIRLRDCSAAELKTLWETLPC